MGLVLSLHAGQLGAVQEGDGREGQGSVQEQQQRPHPTPDVLPNGTRPEGGRRCHSNTHMDTVIPYSYYTIVIESI